jgi:WD40 repeat protein
MSRLSGLLAQPPRLDLRWRADISDHVAGLGWSPDGKQLAAAAVGGPIFVLDAGSGSVAHRLAGHGFGTATVAWQPGGNVLASAGQDGKARLWDAATGKELAQLVGGAAWVERLAWSSDGRYLATAAGKKLKLWDAAGTLLRQYPDAASTIADVTWRPRADDLTVAAYGGVTVYGPTSDTPRAAFEWKGSVLALAWSPDGKFIATGNQDATVHFWYFKSGQDLHMSGYPIKVRELAWDPASRYLATGGGEQVTVWDCAGKGPEGTQPAGLNVHADRVTVLAYQKSGPVLASGGADGLVALWQPGKFKKPLAKATPDAGAASEVTQVAWSPTDTRLAVGTAAGTVAAYST